jgi:hypothetical protein
MITEEIINKANSSFYEDSLQQESNGRHCCPLLFERLAWCWAKRRANSQSPQLIHKATSNQKNNQHNLAQPTNNQQQLLLTLDIVIVR